MQHLIRSLCVMALVPAVAWRRGEAAAQAPHPTPPNPAHPPAAHRQPPRPEVGGGHIPRTWPQRPCTRAPPAQPARARHAARPDLSRPPHPSRCAARARANNWVGHDSGRNDIHYHLDHPWEHGHFTGRLDRARLAARRRRGDRFASAAIRPPVAPYDYDYCSDWLWDNDDIVIYDDPDHPGWYVAYNVRLGTDGHVSTWADRVAP